MDVCVETQTETFYTPDLAIYKPPHVQVDDSGLRTRFRFCKASRLVNPTKISSAILPVQQTFDDFGSWAKMHSKVKQSHEVFQPHNRGFHIPLKKETFCGNYASLVSKDALFPVAKKLEWDEAVSPFPCLPIEDLLLSFPEEFTKIFSRKKLEAGVASEQLMI